MSRCAHQVRRRRLANWLPLPGLENDTSCFFIGEPLTVAMKGRRTTGRWRLLPSTELFRSRRSANDGSVFDHAVSVSFCPLVGQGEQYRRHARFMAFI